MIDTPEIVEVPVQTTASLAMVVPASEIMHHMGPGIQEVYRALADQGIEPAGPWFTHHFRRPSETFDFEICVPVKDDVTPQGRVRPGVLPAHRAVRTIYHGGYHGLGNGWGEFMRWIEDQGLKVRDDLWEAYVIGPDSAARAEDYETQLNKPLA